MAHDEDFWYLVPDGKDEQGQEKPKKKVFFDPEATPPGPQEEKKAK